MNMTAIASTRASPGTETMAPAPTFILTERGMRKTVKRARSRSLKIKRKTTAGTRATERDKIIMFIFLDANPAAIVSKYIATKTEK
jgi:hypothetical protein